MKKIYMSYQLMSLGEPVCLTLKNIYFTDRTWFSCYLEVAVKLIELKKYAREFYKDQDDLEMLQQLGKLSNSALKAFFEKDSVLI